MTGCPIKLMGVGEKLDALESEIKATIATLPEEKRILVTAHDAFNYFGKAYGFNVVGLQGISTATEAGVKDVQNLSEFITLFVKIDEDNH